MTARTPQLWRAVAAVAVSTALVSGCALGERPTLADAPTATGDMTGDPNIDAVLQRLDTVENAVFTAEYHVVLLFGGTQSSMRVVQTSPTRRSVTVGDVRYLTDGNDTRTCDITTGSCEPGINAARVSNTGVTPDMVTDGIAKRLRLDATANVADTSAATETMSNQLATCVDVPLSRGTSRYCVFDDGLLARYAGGDATLDLVSYSPTPDESLFLTTRNG